LSRLFWWDWIFWPCNMFTTLVFSITFCRKRLPANRLILCVYREDLLCGAKFGRRACRQSAGRYSCSMQLLYQPSPWAYCSDALHRRLFLWSSAAAFHVDGHASAAVQSPQTGSGTIDSTVPDNRAIPASHRTAPIYEPDTNFGVRWPRSFGLQKQTRRAVDSTRSQQRVIAELNVACSEWDIVASPQSFKTLCRR